MEIKKLDENSLLRIICSFTPARRKEAIDNNKEDLEKMLDVTIEYHPFTYLPAVKPEHLILSVKEDDNMLMAVFITNQLKPA